jgi:CBS domain-containing protein
MLDAASIMTRDVISARPGDTVSRVARMLSENNVSAVPVCDADGTLLGMVSEGDLMRPYVATNVERRARWLTLLAEGNDLAPEFVEYVRLDSHNVAELMTTVVISAGEHTGVTDLAELMVRNRIKRVPILRDGKLVGIVSRADVIRAIARSPDVIIESD